MPNAESHIDWHGTRTFATYALLVLFLGTVVGLLLNWLRLSFDLDPTTPNPHLPQAHADWVALLWVIAVVPVIGMLLRGGAPRVIWGLLLTARFTVSPAWHAAPMRRDCTRIRCPRSLSVRSAAAVTPGVRAADQRNV